MKLLLLETDSDFARILTQVLDKAGFRVEQVPSAAKALSRVRTSLPDLLILGLDGDLAKGDQLLTSLRKEPVGATLPILLMSATWSETDPRVQRLLSHHRCQGFLARPFPMLDLAERLKAVAADAPTLELVSVPVPKPDRKTLRLLQSIWTERRTGVLRLATKDDWALFTAGAAMDDNSLALARQALYEGGATFSETNQSGSASILPFSALLMEGCMALVQTTFVLQRDKTWASPGKRNDRLEELDASESVEALLQESSDQVALGTLLNGTDEQARELAAMAQLGVIEFQPISTRVAARKKAAEARRRTAARALEAPTPAEMPDVPETSDEAAPTALPSRGMSLPEGASEDAAVTMKRLVREWEALQGADHYTVLGASPRTPPDRLEAQAQRMVDRYGGLASDERQPQPVRELARKILVRVEDAQELVAGRKQAVATFGMAEETEHLSREDQAFQEGQTAMEAGLYERAALCFTAARNERLDSARNLAWLGWATYHNVNLSLEDRCKEGLDFLRLASSFDPHHKEGQYFLAFIEGKHGKPEQAVKRLQGLLQDDPGNRVARTLLNSLRRDLGI
jgi:CheY-like chemotaxis protein